MELRQLVQFMAVAEAKNFRRAAEGLHMAQPPLSQAIRRLENELDVCLFNRTSRSVELTEPGKIFYRECQSIVSHLDSAVLLAQRAAQGNAGKLSVSFTVPWAYEVVPPVLSAFRAAHPDVILTLREVSSSDQVRHILNGDLDVGFLRVPGTYEAKGVEMVPLREDRLAVVLDGHHPLKDAKSISLQELQAEQFILPPFRLDEGMQPFSFRMQVMNLCMEAGYTPRVVHEARHMQTIARLVEIGLGISLIPGWTRRHFSSHLIYRDLACDSDLCKVTLAAAWNSSNPSPALRRFVDIIRAQCMV